MKKLRKMECKNGIQWYSTQCAQWYTAGFQIISHNNMDMTLSVKQYSYQIPYSAEYTRRREHQNIQRGACIQV